MSKYLYKIIKANNKVELKEDIKLELVLDEKEEYDYIDIVDLLNMNFYMYQLDNEENYCIAFDYYYRLLGVLRLSEGNYKESYAYRTKLGQFLLLTGARKFCVCHNHPDDILEWSKGDMDNWVEIIKLGQLLEIEDLGSLIITPSGWTKIGDKEPTYYEEGEVLW